MFAKIRIGSGTGPPSVFVARAGFKDVEDLVLKSIPKARQEYDAMKMMLDDYNAGFEQRLPLLLTSKRAGGRDFLLPNEDLMKTAFKTAENLRQLQTTLGNNPQTASIIERGAIDWVRGKGVLTPEGLVDPKKIRQVLDKNKNIVEALPANVQMKLQDEVKFADDYVRRLGELDKRRVAATDSELDRLLAKATRPGADPAQTLALAMRDPATMQTLVRGVEKDPEMLAALRRAVFDIAQAASEKGGSLKSFIDSNEKAMKVLFKDAGHLEDLKKLAEIQRRVFAFSDVTGTMPLFEATDDRLKRFFGFGIQFGTTTLREAATGRINPTTGALALGLRMAGNLEKDVYARMMTRALESDDAAKALTNVGSEAEAKRAAAELQKIGITMSQYMGDVARGGVMQETTQATLEGRQSPVGGMQNLPVVPKTSAQQMLRAMPPAPPTRGTNFNPRIPEGSPKQPGNTQLMYPMMFPNDPISGLLQQRQAQIQQQKLADQAAAAQAANNKKLESQLNAQLRQIQQATAGMGGGFTLPDYTAPSTTRDPGGSADTKERATQPNATGISLAKFASQFAGKVPYVDAGPNANPKTGWGCSQFTRYVLKKFGVDVDAYSPSQFSDKRGQVVKFKDLQPGDLVFFDHKSGTYSGHHPNHVGIYIGNGNMVAAANPRRGTAISSVMGERDYVGARRFINSGSRPTSRASVGTGVGGTTRVAVKHKPVTPVVVPTWVGALASRYNVRPHFGWSIYN